MSPPGETNRSGPSRLGGGCVDSCRKTRLRPKPSFGLFSAAGHVLAGEGSRSTETARRAFTSALLVVRAPVHITRVTPNATTNAASSTIHHTPDLLRLADEITPDGTAEIAARSKRFVRDAASTQGGPSLSWVRLT